MCQAIKSYDRDEQQQQQDMSLMDAFFEGLEVFHYPNDKAKPILGAIALILYDGECSSTLILYD
jgi:hypothetical protein